MKYENFLKVIMTQRKLEQQVHTLIRNKQINYDTTNGNRLF